jgi:hypothetical protein
MKRFHLGNVHVLIDRQGFTLEGHYWPVNNYWVDQYGEAFWQWRKPANAAYRVTRDHALDVYWGKAARRFGGARWPLISITGY